MKSNTDITLAADGGPRGIFHVQFNEHQIRALVYKGQIVMLARDVGAALGYGGDGRFLVDSITGRWGDEFENGVECVMVTNADVDMGSGNPPVLNDRGQLALTKDGVFLALTKCRTKPGKLFRRWFIRTALPILEKVSAGRPVTDDERRALGVGVAEVFGVPAEDVPAPPPTRLTGSGISRAKAVTRLQQARLARRELFGVVDQYELDCVVASALFEAMGMPVPPVRRRRARPTQGSLFDDIEPKPVAAPVDEGEASSAEACVYNAGACASRIPCTAREFTGAVAALGLKRDRGVPGMSSCDRIVRGGGDRDYWLYSAKAIKAVKAYLAQKLLPN